MSDTPRVDAVCPEPDAVGIFHAIPLLYLARQLERELAQARVVEWQPIETYDAIPVKKRPEWAVFYFRAENTSRLSQNWLKATVQMERRFGSRVCTHWMPLPPAP